jgi:hypothetical protein
MRWRRQQRDRPRGQDIAATGHDGAAPHTDYADEAGGVLTLRWALPARSRLLYERVLAATPDDEYASRATEFLFRRLAVRWEVSGHVVRGRTALIDAYRRANEAQQRFVAAAVRDHAAEHYPELDTP